MRIAQIAPIVERVPPKTYGGTERVVHALTEQLVSRGHDVTLFATGDSKTSARLVSVYPRGLREASANNLYGANPWTMLHIGTAFVLQNQFDIIHDHLNLLALPAANIAHTPVIMTLHGPIDDETTELYRKLNNVHFISISNSQREPAPDLNYAATIYNGLPMQNYPISKKRGDYLLFVGRIAAQKGVHIAVWAAEKLKMKLIIAAKLDTSIEADQRYYRRFIKPKLSKKIKWIGEVEEAERNRLMSRALCFLHLVTWREPFGLTMIEAMACGCPVIAQNQGSIPEIVVHGKTGFVVENKQQLLAGIKNIAKISKKACREYALANFSDEKMADAYEQVYEQIIAGQKVFLGTRARSLEGVRNRARHTGFQP